MSGVNRLPAPAGLLVDHDQSISFEFEGKRYQGLAGDCIASALAANDQWLISRSFKYHRPRGVLTMAGQDANVLVQLPTDPNVLADRYPITEGLRVHGQHYKGSLEKDREAWIGTFAKFLPVGFYYKAFYKPKGAWEKWAPLIRRKAGLGVVDPTTNPGYYDKQYKFYDVAVVGGGPAGMQAAVTAAQAGAEVLLVDENPVLGGSLTYARFDIDEPNSEVTRQRLLAAIQASEHIEVMTDATCNGWFTDNWLAVIRGKRLYKVRAREVVLAAGVMEQPAIFRNNDLPGVVLGSAAQRLIRLYGVRPGRRAVVLTGNDDGYGVALDLAAVGIDVAAIVDMRSQSRSTPLVAAAREHGIKVILGHTVYEAISGDRRVKAVMVSRIIRRGQCEANGDVIDCDLLCVSVGYIPTYQLALHAGAKLHYDDDRAMFSISDVPAHMRLAGSVNGIYDLDAVLADGRRAGWLAANALGLKWEKEPLAPEDTAAAGRNFAWPIFPHPNGKDFVDYDEDLQVADIINAIGDGYEDVQLVKRYSTVGMGPSQGRNSALATSRLVADAMGRTVAETGVTTARPPFAPERIAHCAGRSFYPERHSSMHYRHLEAGAQMLLAGVWLRPAYYGPKGERDRCMSEESLNVRNNVGLVDVSTLGGIEVRGPDAAELLNRIYTFAYAKQQIGRSRYVAMTNEQGVVIDDGVACRLHEQLYYVTATTGGVDRVYQSMLRWNAQWRLSVDIGHVTNAWCGVNIAGPRSRDVLAKLCADVDLSAEGFPYMGVREGRVAGIPARLLRVGFVGELGYEVHVPQHCGEVLWDVMMEAGQAEGIKPFGIETQRLLRLEKGHIIIGQDTDAMSHPGEVHLAWAIARKKPFFVGGRSIKEIERRPLRRKLAGFVINDLDAPMPQESHLVLHGTAMTGRVTSCYFSPTIGKPIGLAFMAPDQAVPGQTVTIKSTGGVLLRAEVVELPFYDPENKRQEM